MTSAKCCSVVLWFVLSFLKLYFVRQLERNKLLFFTSPKPNNNVIHLLNIDFFGEFEGEVCHGGLQTYTLNQKSDEKAGHNIVCF